MKVFDKPKVVDLRVVKDEHRVLRFVVEVKRIKGPGGVLGSGRGGQIGSSGDPFVLDGLISMGSVVT